jgi:hypothetical protein
LKGKKYKEFRQSTFAVEVTKGNYVVMVFKRVEGEAIREWRWPSKAIDLFNVPGI